jgi:hypothetical protein
MKCSEMVQDRQSSWGRVYPCKNKALPGSTVCGVHTPKPRKETKYDRYKKALDRLLEVVEDHPSIEEIRRLLGVILFDNEAIQFRREK